MAVQPARRMLKISKLRMALRNQAHTVIGRRGRVIPLARRSIVVTAKLRAVARAAIQKTAAAMSQRVMPESSGRKKDAVMPNRERMVSQRENRLRVGKAISSAPIWRGRR